METKLSAQEKAPFHVAAFNRDTLTELITESCPRKITAAEKSHTQYLYRYLKHIDSQTIIAEFCYTDHDYLEDYASYYIRCFNDYDRRCTRLHFFSDLFTAKQFDAVLSGQADVNEKFFQDSYLGFMVIKPLPQTVIGKTCLKTWPKNHGRFYLAKKTYRANLFGLDLKIEDTLAFQEQDSVVSACATSALWSAFHGISSVFDITIPSPVEITKAALDKFPSDSRSFPNKGLDQYMMAQAIRSISLEPFKLSASNEFLLKGSIYSYLKIGIPPILGFDIYTQGEIPSKFIGTHAVTVAGYNLRSAQPIPQAQDSLQLKALRIDKLYVHDDQIGPFARMNFDGTTVTVKAEGKTHQKQSLSTKLVLSDENEQNLRAVPLILLIPLYHKVRIPYELVYEVILSFDKYIRALPGNLTKLPATKLEWDIYLSTVNTIKSNLLATCKTIPNPGIFRSTLVAQMPKFIWRAIYYEGEEPVLDLLFDATDIEQNDFFLRCIECNSHLFRSVSLTCAETTDLEEIYGRNAEWPILRWFRDQGVVKS
jgi:hypothetical protein